MKLTKENYFDWKFYVKEYPILFLKTKDDAIKHWESYGEVNNYLPNKYFKMYQDFNWKNYISNYDDLKHIDNKINAFIHFINIGSDEGRSYKKIINFKYIKQAKKLRALLKKINQGDAINKDDNEITYEDEREKIINKLYETFEINANLNNEIRNYEKKTCDLQNQINELNKKFDIINDKNNQLNNDKINLTNKLNNLDDTNSLLSKNNNILTKKNNLLNSQLSKLSQKNNKLNNQLDEIMIKYDELSISIKDNNEQNDNESFDKLIVHNHKDKLNNDNLLNEKIEYLENIIVNLKNDLNKEKQLNDKLFKKLSTR
jgi:chromosome segregation ATPase